MRVYLALCLVFLLIAYVDALPVPVKAIKQRAPVEDTITPGIKKRTLKQWNPRQQTPAGSPAPAVSKRAPAPKPSAFVKK